MGHASHHSTPSKLPRQLYCKIPEFVLESGELLQDVVVAFTFRGLLNPRRDNAVLICHALSGSADVEHWWPSLLKSSSMDLSKYCVICCNSLGSPYGSSSPLTYPAGNAKNGCYGPRFPKTTIRDDVRAHKYVLDILGVKSLQCVIGLSMGGMAALEWCFYGRDYVRAVVAVATTARQGGWQIAWGENQKRTIMADGKFRGGHYGDDPPLSGLAAARMAALLTYRSHYSFEKRFGRRLQVSPATEITNPARLITEKEEEVMSKNGSILACDNVGDVSKRTKPGGTSDGGEKRDTGLFAVQSYLRHHGDKFNARFDANCYIHILDKMDSHDITRGRCPLGVPEEPALRKVLARIEQRVLVVGILSDGIYPIEEQQILAENIPNATTAVIDSRDGHDAFLIESEQLGDILRVFLDGLNMLEKAETLAQILGDQKEGVLHWASSF